MANLKCDFSDKYLRACSLVGKEEIDFAMRSDVYRQGLLLDNNYVVLTKVYSRDDAGNVDDFSEADLAEMPLICQYKGLACGESVALKATLSYRSDYNDKLDIEIELENESSIDQEINQFSFRLGFDSEQIDYPEYYEKLFPTFFRTEKSHIMFYLQSPAGHRVIGISDDPVQSYHIDYECKKAIWSGHRIFTASLDLIQSGELPRRHPKFEPIIKAGEKRSWKLHLKFIKLDSVRPVLSDNFLLSGQFASLSQAPILEADRYCLENNQKGKIYIFSKSLLKSLTLYKENLFDCGISLNFEKISKEDYLEQNNLCDKKNSVSEIHSRFKLEELIGTDIYIYQAIISKKVCEALSRENVLTKQKEDSDNSKLTGRYIIQARNEAEYSSEAELYFRHEWSWYLEQGRKACLNAPQKVGSHAELFYGFYTAYLASRYLPNVEIDDYLNEEFNRLVPIMFDLKKGTALREADVKRIQNSSTLMGILIDKYEARKDLNSVIEAIRIGKFLLSVQRENGGYYAGEVDYTSVIYPAKSLMELMRLLMNLDLNVKTALNKLYKEEYKADTIDDFVNTLHKSLEKSMERLVYLDGNFETEGEGTYEDGANTCAATELAEFADIKMSLGEEKKAKKYTEMSERLLRRHACLEQLYVPDCRMHGATLRFWEAAYDIGHLCDPRCPNMMNSPHGWTAWVIYAYYNLYLLTARLEYLKHFYNLLATVMQLVDEDGKLNWAFVPDPQRECLLMEINEKLSKDNVIKPVWTRKTIGETYMPMVSTWWRTVGDNYCYGHIQGAAGYMHDEITVESQGSASDQDVHEIFKALCETTLTYCYLHNEHTNLTYFNCEIEDKGDNHAEEDKGNESAKEKLLAINLKETVIETLVVFTDIDLKVIITLADGKVLEKNILADEKVQKIRLS